MLVYYFVPFIVSNCYLLFWVSNGHNSVTIQNRTHVYMNFFDHKDLENHLLPLCPKVVKHPVYISGLDAKSPYNFTWQPSSRVSQTLRPSYLNHKLYSLLCASHEGVKSNSGIAVLSNNLSARMKWVIKSLPEDRSTGTNRIGGL